MARPILRVVSLVVASVILLLAACSGSENAVKLAELEEGCLIDTDCTSPLVCAFKTCHEQCFVDGGSEGGVAATPDCPAGQLCVASDRPYFVCQPILLCSLNSQCPSPQVCARDGECRDQCETARDCVTGQSCIDGTCVAANDPDLVDGGLVAPDSGLASDGSVTTAEGATCSYNSDCPDPLECRGGLCAFACVTSRDCTAGQSCVAGSCVSGTILPDGGFVSADGGSLPPDYGATCALNSDCSSTLICGKDARCVYECNTSFDCDIAGGACCSGHMCLTGSVCTVDGGPADGGLGTTSDAGAACDEDLDCQDGLFCDGYERCVDLHCQPAAPACDDQDVCTVDTCDETAKTCTHSAPGATDADHDGHVVIACGGDDCDDTNPDIYPGHPEICDGFDNNCDGFADEGLWTNQAPLALASVYSTSTDVDNTPPIVRLNDGSFAVLGAGSTCANSVLFHVNAAVTSTDGGTTIFNDGDCNVYGVLATDGVSVFASQRHDYGQHFTSVVYTPGGTPFPAASESTTDDHYSVSSGAAVYLPSLSHYGLVYSDPRLFGTGAAYGSIFAASVTAAGSLADDYSLVSSMADDIGNDMNAVTAASHGHATRIQAASNGSNVLVAWTANDTSQVRYALFDLHLVTLLAGPFDLAGTDQVIAESLVTTGGSYVLATSDATETQNRLIALDGATGAAGATLAVGSTLSVSDIRLSALGTGIAVTLKSGGDLRYGYVPAALNKGVAFTDLHVGPATGSVAPVDSKHAALTWYDQNGSDTTLKVAMMVCGGT